MKNVLFYYGWLNSFNSARNGWSNDNVADEIAHYYDVLVCGDGVQDPSHGDYANTQYIIARLKQIKPEMEIFGYIDTTVPLATFHVKVDQCEALKMHGIFMDKAGYDFGTTRADFNAKVDYIHSKAFANKAFPNAWKLNSFLGTDNDVSFPNAIYNPSLLPSSLKMGDYVLLESFGIAPNAVAGNPSVYEPASQSYNRGLIASKKALQNGVRIFSVSIIGNTDPNAQSKFDYLNKLAVSWNLDGFGSSDYNYGAGASVVFWDRKYS